MRQAALDFILSVRTEQARVHQLAEWYEKPLERGQIQTKQITQLKDERSIILEHARQFVSKVESIITIMQWKEFEKLTSDCKTWVKDEVAETHKKLNFILSED